MTVPAPNAVAAATRARALVFSLELAQVDTLTALEIRTEAERARQLAEPTVPALVGTSEIADMAGVSRQQVFYLAKRPGFPVAVQKIGGRVLRRRDAVEHWLSTRRHERSEQSAPADGGAVRASARATRRPARAGCRRPRTSTPELASAGGRRGLVGD
ncbi:helix-turn-helix transcriptional regulator [Micrococcus luteus]|uniref:helix-turn-helix transcriptional regulator n=1 Tax=Micrococcus luteus TaxID=1270 RepID=UPI00288E2ECB|nr:hypothetical protein [Micrococcus luteus]MDT1992297.1 hypothetical protein [Micrococcus luteus]